MTASYDRRGLRIYTGSAKGKVLCLVFGKNKIILKLFGLDSCLGFKVSRGDRQI